ncbi:hypothetical protein HanRHA438_Chr14g0651741 [Helianthus annuus]|nr:hypothetical protein HanOQP8_Chr14g0529681 [Helianthus annuus]KAJ0840124.1 hypothetical protein HanPSC8_Chr14g0614971 [Helianthus annuus]KAJ0853484.1 hypothetical protein HanRHA438_Chr14g0651741 [Helianthus annuus]
MPMLWRVLYTLEQIINKEGLSFGLTELPHLYNLVSHGSHRFLFKAKPQHRLPLLKTTKNETNWKNQFFIVRRDSIPNGNCLPKKWNLKVTSFASLRDTPTTAERVAAFWALDTTVRTFKPRVKDLEETSSASYTMSSATKFSSKSASKFVLGDVEGITSPRSIKKELATSPSQAETKSMTTRAKAGSKRKKPSEPSGDASQLEQQIHEFISKGKRLAEVEEGLLDLQAIATTKDKRIFQLENEVKALEKQIMVAEIQASKDRLEVADEAKVSSVIIILKAKIKMVQEAMDRTFDRAE